MLPVVAEFPTQTCELLLAQMGGAISSVAPEATAYRHRDARFIMNIHGRWHERKDDDRCKDWTRRVFEQK